MNLDNETHIPEPPDTKESDNRSRIIDAAGVLFFQYGIKSVSMDDVARELGMSKRTLYDNFGDKQELVIACISKSLDKVRVLQDQMTASGLNVLEIVLRGHMQMINTRFSPKFQEDLRRYPKAIEMLKNIRCKQSKHYIDFFNTGIEQGVFRQELNYGIVEVFMRRLIEIMPPMEIAEQFSTHDIHNTMFLIFLRGISTAKGLEIIDDYVSNDKLF